MQKSCVSALDSTDARECLVLFLELAHFVNAVDDLGRGLHLLVEDLDGGHVAPICAVLLELDLVVN